ncbi:hypothetical protein Ddye_009993 [Dipteronia dyeriana]|uniref:RNase H type-1 domain-containing protein n=1 Tax=Dipteronia dyeriana TaxID=168575 RepID=A0AAD9XCD0_9ROSI|nr:hypothetical protein Ddye_009993 [Dipteronia dyeriana]
MGCPCYGVAYVGVRFFLRKDLDGGSGRGCGDNFAWYLGLSKLKVVRKACGFIQDMYVDDKVSFKDFFHGCLSQVGHNEVEVFSVMLWRIWFLRNLLIPGTKDRLWLQALRASKGFKATYDLIVVEVMPILRSIKLAFEPGLVPFITEIDALGVMNIVNSREPLASDIGPVVNEIVKCLRRDPRGSMTHVSIKANFVAHTLSKHELNVGKYCFWIEDYPPCVERYVLDKILD